MKVAVIGAGLFGISVALELDKAGHDVTLFEKNADILQAASGINQYRLHRGYHYPRSSHTISSCLKAEPSFLEWYGQSVIKNNKHYYSIAKKNSKTSSAKFEALCQKFGLDFISESPAIIDQSKIEASYRVKEYLIDLSVLKEICKAKLSVSSIDIQMSTQKTLDNIDDYDHVVVSTYANINDTLGSKNIKYEYQFEVCEKPVVKLPEQFGNISIVIMDGPFMCVDPFGQSVYHVMGNVTEAIHHSNTGYYPIVPEKIKPLLNKGVIKNPPVTAFAKFIESTRQFMPLVSKAIHVGSMYTIRTVLPHIDKTDDRPTIVQRINNKITTIFSGKLVNCVEAAREVRDFLSVI